MKIVKRSDVQIKKVKMNCDYDLCNNLSYPLNTIICGSLVVITAPSGGGKTNLLINLFSQIKHKITHERQSFKGLFNNIYIVSPSLHTINNNIFSDLDTIYEEFNEDFLDDYNDIIAEQKEDNDLCFNCIILDDCADNIKDKDLYKKFIKLINNRRHSNTTIFILCQNIIQLPPSIRKNMTQLIAFQSKSLAEEEMIFSFTKQPKKLMRDFFNFIYDEKYNFLFIDMSLKNSGKYIFHRNFDKIEF